MSTPTTGAVSLADASTRTVPALIADGEALWVCARCGFVCCGASGTTHACGRCGARYVVQESLAPRPLSMRCA